MGLINPNGISTFVFLSDIILTFFVWKVDGTDMFLTKTCGAVYHTRYSDY